MSWLVGLQIIGGLVLLLLGAELLVRGASHLARNFGISSLVVGLTIIGFATSSPEIAVGVHAAMTGNGGVSLGNVVGSNIFNVLVVLGAAALAGPLIVSRQLVIWDVPVMIGLSVIAFLFSADMQIGWVDSFFFLVGLILYIWFSIHVSRRDPESRSEMEGEKVDPRWWLNLIFALVGLAMLVGGAELLVYGAVQMATAFAISEGLIGLTIVAIGTSLPEVATSIVASLKGERDIAVGNVVGSNIWNILAVLGVGGLAAGGQLEVYDSFVRFDLPVMLAVAFSCLPIFLVGHRIERWEGALFLGGYVLYMTYLVLDLVKSPLTDEYSYVILQYVLPLTIAFVLIKAYRTSRGTQKIS